MPEPTPYTSLGAWMDAVRMQRAAAQDVARLLADTLRQQFPGAAYLTLHLDPERDALTRLSPDTVRDATGHVLHDFEFNHRLPPVEAGSQLDAAWSHFRPFDAFDLRLVLRLLDNGGSRFDNYPEDLRTEDDTHEGIWLLCLLLSTSARPDSWPDADDLGDMLLRPYHAPRPQQ
ncbi:hypothetical protein [Streptomyces violascens]|uniref:hypothetical protein n=1 Tax=Streptomyces violascens TaxID=67381 RepID=UPI0036C3704D